MLKKIGYIYLRHGETEWNAQGLSQGNVDIPLNANGIAQAYEAASKLGACGIGSIVCSTLGRARQTAAIVAEALQLSVTEDGQLREASFGEQEGLPMGEWYDRWVQGNYTPQGGEIFADLRVRAVAAMNRALTGAPTVLVVAHGALFRALRAEMGHSATIRTANGVATRCKPADPAWRLELL